MHRSITAADIARQLGVNQSTVSRALRNDPRVARRTRDLIQKKAQELGYEPNSFARTMSIIRQSKRPVSKRGALALLVPEAIPEPPMLELYNRCRARAETLGYDLSLIHFREPGIKPQRLTQILKARGILGIMVLPDFASSRVMKRLQLDWSLFPAVTLGNALLWPPLHRVSDNHFGNAKRLVRELGVLGYRRIGLCVKTELATLHADGAWEGGYTIGMQRLGYPATTFQHNDDWKEYPQVADWIQRENLEAVVVDSLAFSGGMCTKPMFGIPQQLGVASLMTHPSSSIAGINPQYEEVWCRAVDFLIHLIHTQERGIPRLQQRLLVDGIWQPGETLTKVWGA